jgi:hypothetical protein
VVGVVVQDADAGVVEFDGALDLAAQGQLAGMQGPGVEGDAARVGQAGLVEVHLAADPGAAQLHPPPDRHVRAEHVRSDLDAREP